MKRMILRLIAEMNDNEKKILNVLHAHRNFLSIDQIARFSRLDLHTIEQILEKLEQQGYVISTPLKRLKKPYELAKEYLKRGIPSTEPYKIVGKEYRLTKKGLMLAKK